MMPPSTRGPKNRDGSYFPILRRQIISNTKQQFRACFGSFQNGALDPAVTAALNVQVGDAVRFIAAKPRPVKEGYDAPSSI